MPSLTREFTRGLEALRAAVVAQLDPLQPALAAGRGPASSHTGPHDTPRPSASLSWHWLLTEVAHNGPDFSAPPGGPAQDDRELAASSEESEADRHRLIALVELARTGDTEAFGLLYDHYSGAIYRFLYYRTRSQALAEDLASETFFRALRSMTGFRWQGKDFGAWLMTIARNLATDHFKAGRTRLELTTDDMGAHDDETESPESEVIAGLTNEILMQALAKLPDEQRDCVVMRFLQGMSVAETSSVLGRSEGAIKQLQLRGVRNLAKLMPEGLR